MEAGPSGPALRSEQEPERHLDTPRIEEALRLSEAGGVRTRLDVVAGLRVEDVEEIDVDLRHALLVEVEALEILQVHLRVAVGAVRTGRLRILDRFARRRRERAVERVVPLLPRLARLRDDERAGRRVPRQVVGAEHLERVRPVAAERAQLVVPQLAAGTVA